MSNELKALAMAATPGPWMYWAQEGQSSTGKYLHSFCAGESYHDPDDRHTCIGETRHADDKQSCANAQFIAAANPSAVLALIEENERLREALEHAHGYYYGNWPLDVAKVEAALSK